ncbi:MAG: response regulator [Tissierellales bacterium]
MNIFIIEDDNNIIKILEKVIFDRELGSVLGSANDGIKGLLEIQNLKPDIVLVDLLMPGKDGITLVKEAKCKFPDMQFIMVSQVTSKDMIGKAYENGIEYFINKPINAIEVESVIQKVQEKLNMNRKLIQIQSLFSNKQDEDIKIPEDNIEEVKRVMHRIGIIGENGSQDIINIINYLLDTKQDMSDFSVKELCSHFTDQVKTMEQRIRRTATVGMINLANLGIEDYMNEIFTEYSNGLYNFEQIKIEMDFIRGKSKKRGKVNLKKFFNGMIYYCNIK